MVRSGLLLLAVSLLLLTLYPADLRAQNVPGEGSVGIAASLQGQQLDILVPYWVTDEIALAPLFGFHNVENSFTRLRIGAKPKFYQTLGDNFATFIGGQVVFEHFDPNAGDGEGILFLGGGFGGEYFFSPHFSLGVEGQLNIRVADQNEFRTGGAFTGTFYF